MNDILTRIPPSKGVRISYGEDSHQFAELRFPKGDGPFPLLFVIHGGWWSAAFDLTHISHLCARLTSYGIVTCSLEYRKVGDAGGGWPGTFLDVANAIEYFREREARDSRVDIRRAAVLGHSAGGHLALWLGGKDHIPKSSALYSGKNRWLSAVISLAGVGDLAAAWDQRLGGGAVGRLLGGDPAQFPDRYAAASPVELLPMGLKQVLIHGTDDGLVPASQSQGFAQKARAAGDEPLLVPLEGVGHFELIDPESRKWDVVARATKETLGIGTLR